MIQKDLLLVSDGVLGLSFDNLGEKSGEHEAEPGTPSLYQMVCLGCPLMTSGRKVGNIKRSRGPPPCIRWCVWAVL